MENGFRNNYLLWKLNFKSVSGKTMMLVLIFICWPCQVTLYLEMICDNNTETFEEKCEDVIKSILPPSWPVFFQCTSLVQIQKEHWQMDESDWLPDCLCWSVDTGPQSWPISQGWMCQGCPPMLDSWTWCGGTGCSWCQPHTHTHALHAGTSDSGALTTAWHSLMRLLWNRTFRKDWSWSP